MRFANTVPQQALFMMNSPFVVEQAKALATRAKDCASPADKIRAIYRATLARDPSKDELDLALAYVAAEPPAAVPSTAPSKAPAPLTPWERYAQVLLETNEFVFVD
jgi:hypothetical protein